MTTFPHHSHQLSVHDAPRALSAVVFHTAIAMAERRDKGLVKKQLKDHQDKLEDLDTRLSRVEAIQERQEGYRRIRVENSPDLASLWASVENKEVSASELRPRTATVLQQAIQDALKKEVDEDQFQAKAQELSGGRRGAPTRVRPFAFSAQPQSRTNLGL